jgi:hypothetical protein
VSASKPFSPVCPPELSDGLPESLTTALLASDFNLNDVLDAYLREISGTAADKWQQAEYHAKALVRLILAECQYGPALEQALAEKIKARVRVVHG